MGYGDAKNGGCDRRLKPYTAWLLAVGAALTLSLAGCSSQKPSTKTSSQPAATQAQTKPAASQTQATQPTTKSADSGTIDLAKAKEIYNGKCEGCHGPTRAGATGPALLPETVGQLPEDFVLKTITNGREGTAMPAFATQLSADEIKLVASYVMKVKPDQAPTWGMDEIAKETKVYVEKKDYPSKPNHNYNLKNLFFVVEREVSKGAFIDGDSFKLIKEEPMGFAIHEIEYSPDGRFGYTVARNGQIVKFDLYTLEKVAETRACLNARGVAVSRDSKYVLVGCYLPFQMVILSGEDLKPVKVIPTRGTDPDGKEVDSRVAAVADAPKYGVFVAALKEAGQVWIVDYTQADLPVVAKIEKVGKVLHDWYFDPTGRYWVGAAQLSDHMGVIDVKERKLAATIPTGKKPHPGIGANWKTKDGRTLQATVNIGEGRYDVWEAYTWKNVCNAKTGGPGLFVKTHPTSKYVWADAFAGEHKDEIYVFDKEDPCKLVKTIIPRKGKVSIHPEFTYDGKYVFVSIWDKEGEIVVYDAKTLEEVTSIKGLVTPTGKYNSGNRTPADRASSH